MELNFKNVRCRRKIIKNLKKKHLKIHKIFFKQSNFNFPK